MHAISDELINAIPDAVEADRDSCEQAADSALLVLFQIGGQWDLEYPLIISNGVEVWPTPPPWTYPTDEEQDTYQNRLDELLQHVRRNAGEYNEAVETNDRPLAERIAAMCPKDSGQIWNDTNGLARTAVEVGVYRTLELSDATKQAYVVATHRVVE